MVATTMSEARARRACSIASGDSVFLRLLLRICRRMLNVVSSAFFHFGPQKIFAFYRARFKWRQQRQTTATSTIKIYFVENRINYDDDDDRNRF